MANCDVLNWKCIFVNEISGNIGIAFGLAALIYFVVASKLKWGFDTTIALAIPTFILFGLMIAGFSMFFAFATLFIGLLLAWIVGEIFRGR